MVEAIITKFFPLRLKMAENLRILIFYVTGYKQGLVKALKVGSRKGKPFLFKKMTWKKN